jgi:hypothetical protein
MATTAALGVGLFTSLSPSPSGASSHREAPLVAADPQVDGTDLYAFVSPNDRSAVTLISNWIPFEEGAGGPNFYSFAEHTNYDINIDNDGDAQSDIIFRWVFTNHYRSTDTFLYNTGSVTSLHDSDLNFYQTYDLSRINAHNGHAVLMANDVVTVPSNVGAASMPNHNEDLFDEGVASAGCTKCKTWAGQSDDPFFLDLRVFDLIYGANFSEAGDDTLDGFNVNAIAVQVPKSMLAFGRNAAANPVIGIWTTAERPSVRVQNSDGTVDFSGDDVQVSRLGMPLVNEVVVPVGLKDFFNGSQPSGDGAYLPKVEDPELPHVINSVYGLPVPDCSADPGIDRNCDLVPVFLTGLPGLTDPHLNTTTNHDAIQPAEELRLNMSIDPCRSGCSGLGVIGGDNAGFPNGRRLQDDIIDVAVRVTEGVLIPGHDPAVDTLGDGVDQNDVPFQSDFPFLAYPHSGSDASPHFWVR